MKVVVDRELCCGHGICADVAPEVFEVPDDGKAVVLLPNPEESLRLKVEEAVRFCPQMAIDLYEE